MLRNVGQETVFVLQRERSWCITPYLFVKRVVIPVENWVSAVRESRNREDQVVFVREVLLLVVNTMDQIVCDTQFDVPVDECLFLRWSAANSEDDLLLHRCEDLLFSYHLKNFLVDELAAQFWQVPTRASQEFVEGLFVPDGCLFRVHCLAVVTSIDLNGLKSLHRISYK